MTVKVVCRLGKEREILTYDTASDARLGALGMQVVGYRTEIVQVVDDGCADCGRLTSQRLCPSCLAWSTQAST